MFQLNRDAQLDVEQKRMRCLVITWLSLNSKFILFIHTLSQTVSLRRELSIEFDIQASV